MQEFLVILSLVLAGSFWVFGALTQRWILFASAGVFFALLGIGLLSTDWQRYEGNATLTEIGNVTTVETNSTNYNVTFDANPTIFSFAIICLAFALGLVYSGARGFQFAKAVSRPKNPTDPYD